MTFVLDAVELELILSCLLTFKPCLTPDAQAYQRLQIQQQMLQAQRNVSGPIRQQEQQVSVRLNL